jgi:hypothetical protein
MVSYTPAKNTKIGSAAARKANPTEPVKKQIDAVGLLNNGLSSQIICLSAEPAW